MSLHLCGDAVSYRLRLFELLSGRCLTCKKRLLPLVLALCADKFSLRGRNYRLGRFRSRLCAGNSLPRRDDGRIRSFFSILVRCQFCLGLYQARLCLRQSRLEISIV